MAGNERIEVEAGENSFAQEEMSRKGVRKERRRVTILAVVFAVVTLVTMVLPTNMFIASNYQEYTLALFLDMLTNNIGNLIGVFTGSPDNFEARFMEMIICCVSGAALGLCGSTYQGAFNNPLAAPKTLGVMSGGALGAFIYVMFLQQYEPSMPMSGTVTAADLAAWWATIDPVSWVIVNYGKALCSIVGCFLIVGIVVLITSFLGRGRLSNITVIIAGQIFAVSITAIIQFARYYFTYNGNTDLAQELAQIENYTMINTYYYYDLGIIVLPILVCIVIVLLNRNKLTLLSFGDDEAYSMGVDVNKTRYFMIGICTLMTALAISFCGHVAYLGFVSAHIARKIVGPDFRYLLPASVCVGGTLLCIIEWVCNSGLPLASQGSAGAVCSVLGACIFLILAVREGRRGGSGWERSN